MVSHPLFVGIDVAKDALDVALRPTVETWSVANDDAGIAALVAQWCAAAPTLVVLEATGHFHGAVTAALAGAGLPVVVVNPRQVRAFAQAVGILAKTESHRRPRARPLCRRRAADAPAVARCRHPRPARGAPAATAADRDADG
jgi:transposase